MNLSNVPAATSRTCSRSSVVRSASACTCSTVRNWVASSSSAREAARLLAALPDEDRALWATAFYAGARLGELQAMRVRHVQSDGNDVHVLHVQHGWDRKTGVIEPKSRAGVRAIPIPSVLRTDLVEHIERTGRSGDAFLFGRTGAAPFTDSHMRKRARTAWAKTCTCGHALTEHREGKCDSCACAGFAALAGIGFHECRHSYSSYLDAAGISETRADRYMGHSNGSMRARYTHQLPAQLAEDAVTLDAYLIAAGSGKVVSLPTGARTGSQVAQTG